MSEHHSLRNQKYSNKDGSYMPDCHSQATEPDRLPNEMAMLLTAVHIFSTVHQGHKKHKGIKINICIMR
jgi:hypothetical protein